MSDSLQPLARFYEQAVQWAPRLALLVLLLLGGLVVSSLLRRLASWLTRASGVETLAERVGVANFLYKLGFKGGLSQAMGQVAWGAGLLITLSVVAEFLGLPGLATGVSAVMRYVPRALAAVLILLGGLWVAHLARSFTERLDESEGGLDSPRIIGRVLYLIIIVLAATVAAEQAGLQTDLLSGLIQITAAGAVLCAAFALALGSRRALHHVVSRHYYRRMLRPGDHVQVGDVAGTVVDFSPVALIIDDGAEHIIVPCGQLLDQVVRVGAVAPPTPPSTSGKPAD